MKRILFISSIYPHGEYLEKATYNRLQLMHLKDYYDIDVVAPVSWLQNTGGNRVPYNEIIDGLKVYHPTYYYPPKIMQCLHGFFYLESIRKTIDLLVREHTYDFIYSSWLYPDGWVSALIAKQLNIPLYISVLGTDVNRLKRHSLINIISLGAITKAKFVICVSNALKQKLETLGAEKAKLKVLYNGLNKELFSATDRSNVRAKLGIDLNDKIILFVGNIIRGKGVVELSKSFNMLKSKTTLEDVKLYVIGIGPLRKKMQHELDNWYKKKEVIFLGSIPHEMVAKYMKAADVLCLPTYSEGLPNVIMEALCCGTKVVASAVGGIPELAKNNSLLYLIPPKSVPELSRALEISLRDKSISDVSPMFVTWEENVKMLVDIFENTDKHKVYL